MLDPQIKAQCEFLQGVCARQARVMVAIAGPPATGKSTFAAHLSDALTQSDIRNAIVPMDGFHLDNVLLDQMGLRHRKGAPQTFDAQGFVALLSRIKTANAPVCVPVFDREADLSRNAARVVPTEVQVVLAEGNYLLLDLAPWDQLATIFDHTIMLCAPMDVLRMRLLKRWRDHGFVQDAACRKAEENDLPNAQYVLEKSRPADRTIMTA